MMLVNKMSIIIDFQLIISIRDLIGFYHFPVIMSNWSDIDRVSC